MQPDRWNAPFVGLGYFLTTPRLWGWALLASILSFAILIFISIQTIHWAAPFDASFIGWVRAIGWMFFSIFLFVAILLPFIFNICFLKAYQSILHRKGLGIASETASSVWIFFRTIKWRILWPLLILLTLFTAPLLTVPLSLYAINHLAVLEGIDLSLTALGFNGSQRAAWLESRGGDCHASALSATALSFLLSLTFVGWILWLPALYCGAFVWMREENS